MTWHELTKELQFILKKHKVLFPNPAIELTDKQGDKIWINHIGDSWSGYWGLFGRIENNPNQFIFNADEIREEDFPTIIAAAKNRATEIDELKKNKKMARKIHISFDLLFDDTHDNDTISELLEQAKEKMLSDGLSEFVNTDNAEETTGKTNKARTIFGKELIEALENLRMRCEENGTEPTIRQIRRALEKGGGWLCQKTFKTKDEAAAYHKGQADQDGWINSADADDFDWIPDEIWDKEEMRDKKTDH